MTPESGTTLSLPSKFEHDVESLSSDDAQPSPAASSTHRDGGGAVKNDSLVEAAEHREGGRIPVVACDDARSLTSLHSAGSSPSPPSVPNVE
jgi:hypothetical protein